MAVMGFSFDDMDMFRVGQVFLGYYFHYTVILMMLEDIAAETLQVH
jgi:hypothetical protein